LHQAVTTLEFGRAPVFPCAVDNDDDINQLFVDLNKRWDDFDGFVHASLIVLKPLHKAGCLV